MDKKKIDRENLARIINAPDMSDTPSPVPRLKDTDTIVLYEKNGILFAEYKDMAGNNVEMIFVEA